MEIAWEIDTMMFLITFKKSTQAIRFTKHSGLYTEIPEMSGTVDLQPAKTSNSFVALNLKKVNVCMGN
jgi:hypothetical protein